MPSSNNNGGNQEPQQSGLPTWAIIALLILGYLVVTKQIDLSTILSPKKPKPTPDQVDPVPSVAERTAPTGSLLVAAQKVRDKLIGSAKAAELESFYAGTSLVLRSSTAPETVQSFRDRHSAALKTLIAADASLSAPPAVGELVDAVFADQIGLTPGPMDKAKAATASDAVAWACWAARQGG